MSTLNANNEALRSRKLLKQNMFSSTIDQAKGLAILLVILGHINSPVGSFIYSFHIPLFFFLAGIYIKTGYSSLKFLQKGLNRLIVPFLIFGALGILVTLMKNLFLGRSIQSWGDTLTGWLFWADSTHMQHYGFVLWFLPALFWGRSFVFVAVKHLKFHSVLLLVVSVVVGWLASQYVTLPFGLDKALVALPWIAVGYVFFQYHERLLSFTWLSIVVLGLVVVLLVYLGGIQRLDLATKNIGNFLLSIPYTLAVILLIFGLLYRGFGNFSSSVSDGLRLFGNNTMLVLVFHVYTNNAVDLLVNKVLGPGYWLFTFLISVFIVLLAIKAKQRYASSFLFKYL